MLKLKAAGRLVANLEKKVLVSTSEHAQQHLAATRISHQSIVICWGREHRACTKARLLVVGPLPSFMLCPYDRTHALSHSGCQVLAQTQRNLGSHAGAPSKAPCGSPEARLRKARNLSLLCRSRKACSAVCTCICTTEMQPEPSAVALKAPQNAISETTQQNPSRPHLHGTTGERALSFLEA